ncbi:Lrp/AsnC family transcriptional regulator [Rubellimicrobium arenae]|uniref:Lrp/AsnC family transcriptional regulator n=1 Tax=Rubellimicrobium arenae TaxID=2817372 RepID=UPI001B3099D0|nr:Lrp/AsnC family transcriptional regulator [Rubellimicrobium arenae]
MLDDLDRRLLRLLQEDPGQPVPDLAQAAGLTPGRAARRLDRLREAGILRGQEAVIDWRRLGYEVHVSLRVTLDKGAPRAFEEFLAAARDVPEVVEIQTFLGQVDVRLSLIARDLAHYRAIYRDRILTLPRISDIEALMTLSVLQDNEALPL